MSNTSRRVVLRATAGVGLVGLAGCISRSSGASTETAAPTDSPATDESLTDWDRSTDCDRTPIAMYDSVIRVEQVVIELGVGYAPIRFAELSRDEKAILRTVTEDGGYGTCDTSDGFIRFIERVGTHRDQQRNSVDEEMHVYLERDGTYYRLYVEKQDQVYAY